MIEPGFRVAVVPERVVRAAEDEPSPAARSWRRVSWLVIKWSLCLDVIVFVGRRAWELYSRDDVGAFEIRWPWLFAAGIVYLVGWLPSVLFWRRLMARLGSEARLLDASRAYYCGHLGKYIPGKASAILIRAALLKGGGVPLSVSAVTATCETLLIMGTGIGVAVVLCPLLLTEKTTAGWPSWVQATVAVPLLPAALAVVTCAVSLPLIARLLTHFAARMTPRGILEGANSVRVETSFVAAGLLGFVAAWGLHGLSLGLTLHAVGDGGFSLAHWPTWIGAVSFSTAIGFFAIFAPGGIGVREGLLIESLRAQPTISAQQAVAAAVLTRIVWLVAELIAAGGLYWLVRPEPSVVAGGPPVDRGSPPLTPPYQGGERRTERR